MTKLNLKWNKINGKLVKPTFTHRNGDSLGHEQFKQVRRKVKEECDDCTNFEVIELKNQ